MNSNQYILALLKQTKRYWYIILICAIIGSFVGYLYAKIIKPTYTVTSSLYPLSNGNNDDNENKLNELLGGSKSKNLSAEANVSIEEVAKSKSTHEAIVRTILPDYGNKTVAEILINSYDKYKTTTEPTIKFPTTEQGLVNTGVTLLMGSYGLKINKNGLLEVSFSNRDSSLLTPISYVIIAKITEFYKELKVKKAREDFDFLSLKADSLNNILNAYDANLVHLNQTTLFAPKDKLKYSIPQQNLQTSKARVLAQYNSAVSNRENALWRLQKNTPIVEILDKPEPPFKIQKTSKIIYAFVGFILGGIIGILLIFMKPTLRFLNSEFSRNIHKLSEAKQEVPVTTI